MFLTGIAAAEHKSSWRARACVAGSLFRRNFGILAFVAELMFIVLSSLTGAFWPSGGHKVEQGFPRLLYWNATSEEAWPLVGGGIAPKYPNPVVESYGKRWTSWAKTPPGNVNGYCTWFAIPSTGAESWYSVSAWTWLWPSYGKYCLTWWAGGESILCSSGEEDTQSEYGFEAGNCSKNAHCSCW